MSEINCHGDEEYYGSLFPNWALVRLVNTQGHLPYIVNGFEMKEGSWGLTQCNDPDFVFGMNPMEDVMFGLPDDISDEDCPDEPKGYYDLLRHYEERLSGNCVASYYLVKSVIESGWDITEGGFACHVSHMMWKLLQDCNWNPVRISKYYE